QNIEIQYCYEKLFLGNFTCFFLFIFVLMMHGILIDSLVNIAQWEESNKGLGFESVNINEQSHEYFSLSDSDKRILLNLRKEVIEFSLKMVDKIIEEKSNDTVMIILLSREIKNKQDSKVVILSSNPGMLPFFEKKGKFNEI
ncbi:hypothetical protein BpHYR1_051086, partial [Brachionus plicatilis]